MLGLRPENDGANVRAVYSASYSRNSRFVERLQGRFNISGVTGSLQKHSREKITPKVKRRIVDYQELYLRQQEDLEKDAKRLQELQLKLTEVKHQKELRRRREESRKSRRREYSAATIIQAHMRGWFQRHRQIAVTVILSFLRWTQAKQSVVASSWACKIIRRFIERLILIKRLRHFRQKAYRNIVDTTLQSIISSSLLKVSNKLMDELQTRNRAVKPALVVDDNESQSFFVTSYLEDSNNKPRKHDISSHSRSSSIIRRKKSSDDILKPPRLAHQQSDRSINVGSESPKDPSRFKGTLMKSSSQVRLQIRDKDLKEDTVVQRKPTFNKIEYTTVKTKEGAPRRNLRAKSPRQPNSLSSDPSDRSLNNDNEKTPRLLEIVNDSTIDQSTMPVENSICNGDLPIETDHKTDYNAINEVAERKVVSEVIVSGEESVHVTSQKPIKRSALKPKSEPPAPTVMPKPKLPLFQKSPKPIAVKDENKSDSAFNTIKGFNSNLDTEQSKGFVQAASVKNDNKSTVPNDLASNSKKDTSTCSEPSSDGLSTGIRKQNRKASAVANTSETNMLIETKDSNNDPIASKKLLTSTKPAVPKRSVKVVVQKDTSVSTIDPLEEYVDKPILPDGAQLLFAMPPSSNKPKPINIEIPVPSFQPPLDSLISPDNPLLSPTTKTTKKIRSIVQRVENTVSAISDPIPTVISVPKPSIPIIQKPKPTTKREPIQPEKSEEQIAKEAEERKQKHLAALAAIKRRIVARQELEKAEKAKLVEQEELRKQQQELVAKLALESLDRTVTYASKRHLLRKDKSAKKRKKVRKTSESDTSQRLNTGPTQTDHTKENIIAPSSRPFINTLSELLLEDDDQVEISFKPDANQPLSTLNELKHSPRKHRDDQVLIGSKGESPHTYFQGYISFLKHTSNKSKPKMDNADKHPIPLAAPLTNQHGDKPKVKNKSSHKPTQSKAKIEEVDGDLGLGMSSELLDMLAKAREKIKASNFTVDPVDPSTGKTYIRLPSNVTSIGFASPPAKEKSLSVKPPSAALSPHIRSSNRGPLLLDSYLSNAGIAQKTIPIKLPTFEEEMHRQLGSKPTIPAMTRVGLPLALSKINSLTSAHESFTSSPPKASFKDKQNQPPKDIWNTITDNSTEMSDPRENISRFAEANFIKGEVFDEEALNVVEDELNEEYKILMERITARLQLAEQDARDSSTTGGSAPRVLTDATAEDGDFPNLDTLSGSGHYGGFSRSTSENKIPFQTQNDQRSDSGEGNVEDESDDGVEDSQDDVIANMAKTLLKEWYVEDEQGDDESQDIMSTDLESQDII